MSESDQPILASPPTRIPLCQLPTPLHRLDRASAELGIDLWIKRDDLTGFALGGNKGRKLEYLLADIQSRQVDVVVTCGSIQSNFIRQLAAALAVIDVPLVAVVMDLPFEGHPPIGEGLIAESGNRMLSDVLGVDWQVLPNGTWDTLFAAMDETVQSLKAQDKNVYAIPVGGSSPLGAFGFYAAAAEVAGFEFDWIVFASSSGSTHCGLAYGLRHQKTRLLGVACDPEPEIAEDFAKLGEGLAQLIAEPPLTAKDFHLNFDFVGAGYGIPSLDGEAAIRWLARTEGIFLDPIYSGKAFAALMALAQNREIEGRVCFWHTGGIPALFARRERSTSVLG